MGRFVARIGTMTRSVVRPYPGNRPFAEADFDLFFGRSKAAEKLAHLWQLNRLTLAIGTTGTGKTSLLQAGVLPLLQYGRGDVLPPGRMAYGSGYPVAALPEHNPYTLSLLRSWVPGEPVTGLVGLTVRDFVRRRAELYEGPIFAAIDQAEDVLGGSGLRGTYRRDFLDDLIQTLRAESRLHLLLMLRTSAADELARILGGEPYTIGPLSFQSALEAVTRPAERAGRMFAPGAAEELLTDLLTSYVSGSVARERCADAESVPPALLQVVLAQFWKSLPPDLSVITSRDVRAYADADQALTEYCSGVVAAVAEAHHLKAARLRSWLIGTFVTEHGACRTVHEGLTDTAGMPNAVPGDLEDRHLLSSERRSGTRWFQLLSERLIEPLRQAVVDRLPPLDLDGYFLSAERAMTLGHLDVAGRYAGEILSAASPGDFRPRAETHSLLGNVAYERGKLSDEKGLYREAEGHYRESARLFEAARDTGAAARELAAVGQTLLAQGRVSAAVDELEAAVRRLPNDLVVQAELAWAHWQLGEAGTAEAIFSDILSVDAGNVSALRGRGEILADVGKGREAMRDLSRTSEHDMPSTRAARGLALAELGDHGGAVKEIEAAREQAPRNGPVLLYAARAQALLGHQAAAADLAEQAINATDPPLPLHQHDAALKLADRRDPRA
jgi:tetratricopeptide (TPR) repeat protein